MVQTWEVPATGLRERKKQRTRWALIGAALDLFLAKGYEATTIDEIVAAVDVSQRTFFRYFAGKEDVALSVMREHDQLFVATLAGRPADEPPVTALAAAIHSVLDTVRYADEDHAGRFAKVRDVIDHNPALAIAQLRYFSELEHELATILARRMDADPATDLRPTLIAATFLTVMRVAFERCARDGLFQPDEVATRIEEAFALAAETLPRAWSGG
ncbi:TetR family transcriptional regulator [Actinoallomurus purpureus]|uniref:TetR family transcriptional regulator n=1 Tax=Actinoallomurus purpureus TaxID=478114 RepID=UPI0020924178|nr:TetR family transcriptional regulator [Actinoallomurus purpureus]MCO6010304.1 TetR family transcriptional regulator [Actinoallomurus purpureus]